MFVDRVTIFVQGGAGGNGCLSFRREKYAPRGGPNGGDGGHGGSVIIRASQSHSNLAHLSHQRHWKAERGEHGQGSDCFGRGGDDLLIDVRPGTLVRDRDRGHLLRDLKPEDQVVVARGGRGGHGNAHFKSSTNRAPRQVEKGHPGDERWITMELKVIADAGLIGLPNAGKSTLLSRISRAHPEFLRHVERTSLQVHLVEAVPIDGSDPVVNYRTIRNELAQYSPALADRPELLVVTKMDVTGAAEARERIAHELCRDVVAISAVTGQGIPELIHQIVGLLERLHEPAPSAPLAAMPMPVAAPAVSTAGA
jgi:GTP-binding protein